MRTFSTLGKVVIATVILILIEMTKDNLTTNASNEAESPAFLVGTVMCRAGEEIGLKDTNGNDIFIGSVIKHNENLYVIKWSKSQKGIVARSEPLAGKKASWRDFNWIKNLSDKYITMVGTVLFDDDVLKARFKGVY